MSSRRTTGGPLRWLGALVVLYLGAPLVALVVRFVSTPQRGFHQAGLFPALAVSLGGASVSLVLITIFGVPLAYVLARSTSRLAKVVGVLVQIPLALPPLMSGIVLIYLVGPYTFLGRLFARELTNSRTGVVLAMTFVSAPFLVVSARAAFESIDQGLLDVAETLGHGEVSRFARVAVPVAAPGIRAGMVLAWLRAFGEYGAVVVLAYNPTSLPIYTYNQFSAAGLSTTLAPTALALGAAAIVVGLSRVRWQRRARPTPSIAPRAPAPITPRPIRFDVDQHLGSFHLRVRSTSPVRHLAVLGPSGAGKSALVRSLAGLYGDSAGKLWSEDAAGDVALARRDVGYVAQGFSLFPHLSVWQQLLFARGATPELARYWLPRLGLDGLESARPAELSGGQRQRVALGQVLCASPAVLLLDEPFSALDVPVRQDLRRLVRELQRETGLSTVLVTHDPEEAGFLSEDVLVIGAGLTLQAGQVREVFSQPASPEVARLLGIANLLVGEVAADAVVSGGARFEANVEGLSPGERVSWSVRPERVRLAPIASGDAGGEVRGTIRDVAFVGVASDYVVDVGASHELLVRSAEPTPWAIGDVCALRIDATDIALWRETS